MREASRRGRGVEGGDNSQEELRGVESNYAIGNEVENMSSKLISALLVSLMLLLLCVGTGEAQRRRRMKHRPKPASESALTPGKWGGAHISLDVYDGGATVEYDCARGSIDERLRVDRDGRFDARGTFVREGVSIRVGITPVKRPARYEGHVSGQKISLKVTLTDTSQTIGSFTLTRGDEGRLRKCR